MAPTESDLGVTTLEGQGGDQQQRVNSPGEACGRHRSRGRGRAETPQPRLRRHQSSTMSCSSRLESARLSEQAEQSDDDIKFRSSIPPVAALLPAAPNRPTFPAGIACLVAALAAGGGLCAFLLGISSRPVFASRRRLAAELRARPPVLGCGRSSMQTRPGSVPLRASAAVAFGGGPADALPCSLRADRVLLRSGRAA